MKRVIPHPLADSSDTLMSKAGYVRHCVEAGRACYHRRLNDPPFPRFHALVSIIPSGMEIDLHFDALDSIRRKGNHDQAWAYQGGRIDGEMRRILDVLCGQACVRQVYHPLGQPLKSTPSTPKKKRSLFDLLFKSM